VDRWEELFRPPDLDYIPSSRNTFNTGKKVLVTGAGGWIGSALSLAIAKANPRFLILLDHSEENLYQIAAKLEGRASGVARSAILGDIADRELLKEIFDNHRPDIIYHAAAYKHVALMEENPLAVIRNNVLGTQVLAETAAKFEVPRFLMISTDKAANPRSVMGSSKRIAELLLLRMSNRKSQMSAARFGNVFGSNGSVVPRFQEQIAAGGPVTVRHPEAARYFITLAEAVEIILAAASVDEAAIFVPELGAPVKIMDLARHMIAEAEEKTGRKIRLELGELRAGEKIREQLVSQSEELEATNEVSLRRVKGPKIEDARFNGAMAELTDSLRARNLGRLLEVVSSLVPEYTPSATLRELAKASMVRART
jgi:FlaA1/EpsC-like NDP-sugar epimerase